MPRLKLEHYNYTTARLKQCLCCKGLIMHEVYQGHTFCEGSVLYHCIGCFKKEIIEHVPNN